MQVLCEVVINNVLSAVGNSSRKTFCSASKCKIDENNNHLPCLLQQSPMKFFTNVLIIDRYASSLYQRKPSSFYLGNIPCLLSIFLSRLYCHSQLACINKENNQQFAHSSVSQSTFPAGTLLVVTRRKYPSKVFAVSLFLNFKRRGIFLMK